MNSLFKKPHLVFFLAIPIILLIGLLGGDSALDINIHDTYFVIAHPHIAILISIVFGIIGLGYWTTQRVGGQLSKWMSIIHIVLTFGGLLAIFIVPSLTFVSSNESSFPVFDDLMVKNQILVYTVILMWLGQLLFLVNLILAFFRKKNQI